MNNYKNTRCNFCGTLNNAHHSAECIDTNAKGYEATTTPPVSPLKSSELLKAICDNKEVCMLAGSEEQLDADEPRFRIEITGPERILKPLADILYSGV